MEKGIKLSSLNENMRKEVKAFMKEGKVKMSALPEQLKQLIESHVNELDFSVDPDSMQDDMNIYATDGDIYRAQRIEHLLKRIDPTVSVEITTVKTSGKPYYSWSGPSPESWPTAIIRGDRQKFNDPKSQNMFSKVVALFGSGSFIFPFWGMEHGETLLSPKTYESPDFIGSFQMKNDMIKSRKVHHPEFENNPDSVTTHSTYATPKNIGTKERGALKLSSLSEGLRKEVKALMKEGKVKIKDLPSELRTRVMENTMRTPNSLWSVLGIKNITELPKSPMINVIHQICADNGIYGNLTYGRIGGNGIIYIFGEGGYIGIGLMNGQLDAVETGVMHRLG